MEDEGSEPEFKSSVELVAQHLAEAGRTLDAIHYWQQAGERALRAWATEEAATHFQRGLALVMSLMSPCCSSLATSATPPLTATDGHFAKGSRRPRRCAVTSYSRRI